MRSSTARTLLPSAIKRATMHKKAALHTITVVTYLPFDLTYKFRSENLQKGTALFAFSEAVF
jgi:hypothetical protein